MQLSDFPILPQLVSTATSLAWPPLVAVARHGVRAALARITVGQLVITDVDGTVSVYGTPGVKDGSPRAELKVRLEAFWVRVALWADMGFAESYMLDEITCPDLRAFFTVFILNAAALSATTTSNITYTLSTSIAGLARRTNTLSRARLNVSAHYDISNAMFAAFLSSDMTYSCAIWQPKGSPLAAHESLETAQATKLNAIMRYARLRASDHVLEIGSGWGSFAIAAVRATGCRVTTLTLSAEQARLANERIRAAGLQDRIDVRLCDYRALPAPPTVRPYDKIVSIEMLENVGPGLLTTYFACVERLLAPRGGIAVFQCITIPEARYPVYAAGEDFIRRYIFPGGHLPTLTQLVAAVTEGGAGRLVVEGVRNIGGHYAKTLRIWREAFVREWDTIEKEVTARGMDAGVFRRKWEYYFTYCEAGFAAKVINDHIITVAREGTMELLDDIPM